MSVQSETVDLETVVKSTRYIFLAKPIENPKNPDAMPIYQFSLIRVLAGKTDLKPKQNFKVHSANSELYAQIAEMQKRGEPTPFPILSFYGPSLPDLMSAKEAILFLSLTSKGEFKLTMEGSYESVKMLPEIERLIKNTNSISEPLEQIRAVIHRRLEQLQHRHSAAISQSHQWFQRGSAIRQACSWTCRKILESPFRDRPECSSEPYRWTPNCPFGSSLANE